MMENTFHFSNKGGINHKITLFFFGISLSGKKPCISKMVPLQKEKTYFTFSVSQWNQKSFWAVSFGLFTMKLTYSLKDNKHLQI